MPPPVQLENRGDVPFRPLIINPSMLSLLYSEPQTARDGHTRKALR
jgi:hypothetical protein